MLFNLLSNSFKFTNDGGLIYVTLEKNDVDQNVTLKVEDSGIGMSPEFVAHAFELFYQENVGDKLGSGLGLSLSKELIQLHNGSISVQSKQVKQHFIHHGNIKPCFNTSFFRYKTKINISFSGNRFKSADCFFSKLYKIIFRYLQFVLF